MEPALNKLCIFFLTYFTLALFLSNDVYTTLYPLMSASFIFYIDCNKKNLLIKRELINSVFL